jgi:hypothetical protein
MKGDSCQTVDKIFLSAINTQEKDFLFPHVYIQYFY